MKQELIKCQACGSQKAVIKYSSKYAGFRGNCPYCGTNWPES